MEVEMSARFEDERGYKALLISTYRNYGEGDGIRVEIIVRGTAHLDIVIPPHRAARAAEILREMAASFETKTPTEI